MNKILVLASLIFVFTSIGAETLLDKEKRKIEEMAEADMNGPKIAQESKTPFKLLKKTDQITGKAKLEARYTSKFGTGNVEVSVFCVDDRLEYSIVFDKAKIPFVYKDEIRFFRDAGRYLEGRRRVNKQVDNWDFARSSKFGNVIVGVLGTVYMHSNAKFYVNFRDKVIFDNAFDIPTDEGNLFIEMSPYDFSIRTIAKTCIFPEVLNSIQKNK
jgi:hypothetical protein